MHGFLLKNVVRIIEDYYVSLQDHENHENDVFILLNTLAMSDIFCAPCAQAFSHFFQNGNTLPPHVVSELKELFKKYKNNPSAKKVLQAIS